jgi:hypothetical protein
VLEEKALGSGRPFTQSLESRFRLIVQLDESSWPSHKIHPVALLRRDSFGSLIRFPKLAGFVLMTVSLMTPQMQRLPVHQEERFTSRFH